MKLTGVLKSIFGWVATDDLGEVKAATNAAPNGGGGYVHSVHHNLSPADDMRLLRLHQERCSPYEKPLADPDGVREWADSAPTDGELEQQRKRDDFVIGGGGMMDRSVVREPSFRAKGAAANAPVEPKPCFSRETSNEPKPETTRENRPSRTPQQEMEAIYNRAALKRHGSQEAADAARVRKHIPREERISSLKQGLSAPRRSRSMERSR